VASLLRARGLHTVCTGARCPNLAECWARGTATVMILGNTCTRGCAFCAVDRHPAPPLPDPGEPRRVAELAKELSLAYVVITSVTRDDLPDGGASQFVATVSEVRRLCPDSRIELLIPDLRGDALEAVASSGADVVGHNLETVRRLTPLVRHPRASYEASLAVLAELAAHGVQAKTALLLGLGETEAEVEEALLDAYTRGVRRVAMGQYLAPSRNHARVQRYWTPQEFEELAALARSIGYTWVASGPLVRSSYHAEAGI